MKVTIKFLSGKTNITYLDVRQFYTSDGLLCLSLGDRIISYPLVNVFSACRWIEECERNNG